MSSYGAHRLAEREGVVLQEPALRRIQLVDGARLTRGRCDDTEDGRHYASLEGIEARAALGCLNGEAKAKEEVEVSATTPRSPTM